MFAKSLVKACSYNPSHSFSYKGFPLLFLIPLQDELITSLSYSQSCPLIGLPETSRNCLVSSTYTRHFFKIRNNKRNAGKSKKEKDLLFPLRIIRALSVGKRLFSKLLLCPPKFQELELCIWFPCCTICEQLYIFI